MFNSLIDSLAERKLISADQTNLLRELRIADYGELDKYLHVDSDRKVLLAFCEMILGSKHVSYKIDSNKIAGYLINLLKSLDWEVRHVAVLALGNLEVFEQLETLLEVAMIDVHDGVKITAIDAVAHWHLPNTTSSLVQIASNGNYSVKVREAAIEGLGISDSIQGLRTLVALLNDPNAEIRYTALIAIGNAQVPDIITNLESVLNDDTEVNTGKVISSRAQEVINRIRENCSTS